MIDIKNDNVPDDSRSSEFFEDSFADDTQKKYSAQPKKSPGWSTYHYSDARRRRFRLGLRMLLWLATCIFLAGAAYSVFIIYKVNSVEKKINPSPTNETGLIKTFKSLVASPEPDLDDQKKERINILLLGIAGKGKPGQNLTDTIMIASINLLTNQVALLSIPRDFYAKIPEINLQTKINSVYQYGINSGNDSAKAAQLISSTVADITGLNIDHYIVLNFEGFEKIVNSIGGINITNERDIYDARYPGPNYSYETFQLSKGFHHLDGATALKYVRERHNDPEGDFGRAKRQQQVIQATKNKIFSIGTMLDVAAMNDLFNALGETIQTDITLDEIGFFIELSKKLDTQNINNMVLDAWNKESLLKVSHVTFGSVQAFVLVPRVGNYSEIRELAENIFDLNVIKRRKDEIAKEDASIFILNQSGDVHLANKIKKLLGENLEYRNISMLSSSGKKVENRTMVYDLTGGTKPFTLDELVGKLPASASENIPSMLLEPLNEKKADMVISLGKDLLGIYNIEEGTIEDLNKSRDDQESLNLQNK